MEAQLQSIAHSQQQLQQRIQQLQQRMAAAQRQLGQLWEGQHGSQAASPLKEVGLQKRSLDSSHRNRREIASHSNRLDIRSREAQGGTKYKKSLPQKMFSARI